jgi:hypothetical protein
MMIQRVETEEGDVIPYQQTELVCGTQPDGTNPSVHFTNVLRAAFTLPNPKSTKIHRRPLINFIIILPANFFVQFCFMQIFSIYILAL